MIDLFFSEKGKLVRISLFRAEPGKRIKLAFSCGFGSKEETDLNNIYFTATLGTRTKLEFDSMRFKKSIDGRNITKWFPVELVIVREVPKGKEC